jgi:hypothetical protein
MMLIRTICLSDGLCNGTRFKVIELSRSRKILVCQQLDGYKNIVHIPRKKLTTVGNLDFPFYINEHNYL